MRSMLPESRKPWSSRGAVESHRHPIALQTVPGISRRASSKGNRSVAMIRRGLSLAQLMTSQPVPVPCTTGWPARGRQGIWPPSGAGSPEHPRAPNTHLGRCFSRVSGANKREYRRDSSGRRKKYKVRFHRPLLMRRCLVSQWFIKPLEFSGKRRVESRGSHPYFGVYEPESIPRKKRKSCLTVQICPMNNEVYRTSHLPWPGPIS